MERNATQISNVTIGNTNTASVDLGIEVHSISDIAVAKPDAAAFPYPAQYAAPSSEHMADLASYVHEHSSDPVHEDHSAGSHLDPNTATRDHDHATFTSHQFPYPAAYAVPEGISDDAEPVAVTVVDQAITDMTHEELDAALASRGSSQETDQIVNSVEKAVDAVPENSFLKGMFRCCR